MHMDRAEIGANGPASASECGLGIGAGVERTARLAALTDHASAVDAGGVARL